MLTVAIGSVPVIASPLAASAAPTRQYVALGDSYAAGQGGGAYQNACLQSGNGYPALLDGLKQLHLRADATCSGATTSDLQATQLRALNRGTRFVTVTVGGNDLNVAGVAAACAGGPSPACQAAIVAARSLLEPGPGGPSILATRLTASYAAIAAESPRATIAVTGYPYLFAAPAPSDPNAPTILAVNSATTALNDTIRSVVGAAAATGADVVFVDVTGAFAGHGIGSPDPYFVTAGTDAFHPNALGYAAYADAIEAATG